MEEAVAIVTSNPVYVASKVGPHKWRSRAHSMRHCKAVLAVTDYERDDVSCVYYLPKVTTVQVGEWTSSCLEYCIRKVAALCKPYKYVATCIIMQKTGVTAA